MVGKNDEWFSAIRKFNVIRSRLGFERSDLPRSKDGKFKTTVLQNTESFKINRGLRQPHPLGTMSKAIDKIIQTPADICHLVPIWKQRQNAVGIALSHTISNTIFEEICPLLVNNAFSNLRSKIPHPIKQSRSNIKADLSKVPHASIGFITF